MNKSISEYERMFNYFDENGDGKLSPLELQCRVGAIDEGLQVEELQLVVESLDSDGDGLLGLDEFVGLMESSTEDEEEKVKDLREAFGIYEMDDCECITPKSLKGMLSRLGESRTVDECVTMINHFDLNGDGVLSFDEFKVMMLT
ncbi:calcium-binding protein CML38-like [Cornus florida]|uniref:calcium-binding protein CML38-like n=1 Tax=Cornus florida TaxID=4283 RepID=UPI0028A18219|nr:calcium-binding protein CML38-like [Cornus florida]